MKDKNYWFGFMNAGEKSSPVLRDNRIDTGNPETLYLFNLRRNEILEYRRDIIEPKLRELDGKEQSLPDELQSAYAEVRTHFTPRGGKVASIPAKERNKPPVAAANDDIDVDDEKEFEGLEESEDQDWLEEEEA
jgi:hypothetical protein